MVSMKSKVSEKKAPCEETEADRYVATSSERPKKPHDDNSDDEPPSKRPNNATQTLSLSQSMTCNITVPDNP